MNIKTLIETRAAGLPDDVNAFKSQLKRVKQAKHAVEYFGEGTLDWGDLELIDLIGFSRYLHIQQYFAKTFFQNERYSHGFYG